MKILITGGSGLFGQYLNLFLSKKHDILTIYNNNIGNCHLFNSRKVNITNQADLIKVFRYFKPEIVVHTAAITSTFLDGKYSLNEYFKSNVLATEHTVKLSNQNKSRIIYISTDLVYDGNRGSYLSENSKLNPLSPYAESKLIGEEKVKEFSENYLILRLALLIGFGLSHSVSHFQIIFENLSNNKPVKLFTDQFRTPISLIEASKALEKIIELNISNGIYNLGGNERISRYELGRKLVEMMKFDEGLLIPVSQNQSINLAKVYDVSLNTDKLKNYGIKIKSIEEMIIESLTINKQKTSLSS